MCLHVRQHSSIGASFNHSFEQDLIHFGGWGSSMAFGVGGCEGGKRTINPSAVGHGGGSRGNAGVGGGYTVEGKSMLLPYPSYELGRGGAGLNEDGGM